MSAIPEKEICGEPAMQAVFWPGNREPIPMCDTHAHGALRIAEAMGFRLSVITDSRGSVCQSHGKIPPANETKGTT